MKKWIYSILVLFFATSFVCGQKRELSLKEAQKLALSKSSNLKIDSLQIAVAKKKLSNQKWQKIPEIYANYNLRYNLIIPTTPVPAIAFNPAAKKGEIMPLRFSTDWISSGGINLNYDLFNPNKNGKTKTAQQKVIIQKTELQISKNNLKYKVGKAYAAVAIAKAQLELAIADTTTKSTILQSVLSQYKNGKLEKGELTQAKMQKNKAKSNFYEAQQILSNAKVQLALDMGLSPKESKSFIVSDSIEGILNSWKTSNIKLEKKESLSLLQMHQKMTLKNLQIKNTKKGFWPTISLKGFYGGNYYDNQFRLFQGDNWYGNSYVGLSVTLPITQGLERTQKIDAMQLQAKIQKVKYQQQKNALEQKRQKISGKIKVETRKLKASKKNVKLSKKNYEVATAKLKAGQLLLEDWLKSSFLYKKAQTEYLKNAYHLILAQLKRKELVRE